MRTIEIIVYKFNELSKEAQQKAIEKLWDINVTFDWWEPTYEDAKNIGLKITSFALDRNRHVNGEFTLSAAEVAANILQEHGETCNTYKIAEKFIEEFNPKFADYFQTEEGEPELLEMEDNFLKTLLSEYADILQKECEYLQSKESIIETIQANDYDFTEDGKIY